LKFNLIDKIEHLSHERIVAVKYVSLAEEYLQDHFPTFPVLPGVMMLEALTQAAGWLLHHRRQFGRSMAVLKEAKNVKYGMFVEPGDFLRVEVDYQKDTPAGATFKAIGSVDGGGQALSARLELAYFDIGEKDPNLASLDAKMQAYTQGRWAVLRQQQQQAGVAI
jgi:3-hydroxyacyl-[acyl-carrier-protein] dehydratase